MKWSVTIACACLVSSLAGCSQYGPKGDKGLPPPPADLAYPSPYQPGPDRHHALKSAAEQKQLQSDLLAHKPPPRRRPS